MPGGCPTQVIDVSSMSDAEMEKLKETPKVFFNEEKQVFYREAATPNATFFDRDRPEETAFAGKVIRERETGKTYPAIIQQEWTAKDGRGFPRTYARLSVNFGRFEGWKDVTAVKRGDGGHLGKQSYEHGYTAPKLNKK